MVSSLAGAFGVLALLLASVGLYGLMAYLVTYRTREIGIRMALGSSARSVLWLVLKEALILLALGTAAGMAAGMIAARLIANQLFGMSSSDPVTMLGAAVIMLLVTGIAICIPVSRALRVDPARALRYE